jgi:N-acyl-D-amino-acid deacylase
LLVFLQFDFLVYFTNLSEGGAMDFDLVIKNGTVIDGSGAPGFRADVGIRNGKIAAVSRTDELAAFQMIDATGLTISPGFIDIHSHGDWILPLQEHQEILAPLIMQGVTTLVTGNCGFSPAPATDDSLPLLDSFSEFCRQRSFDYNWRSFGEFLDVMDNSGLALNTAFLVGHGSLRHVVMGKNTTPPTGEDIKALSDEVRRAIQEGAFGLSAGLAYAPGIFADNTELLTLIKVVAEESAVFTVHGRAYSWVSPFYQPLIGGVAHNIRSVRELIDLGRAAEVRLQLSHQIFVGRRTWRTYKRVLRKIEQAAEEGLDIAFDAFPYTVGNTTINVVFPAWFLDGFYDNIRDSRALQKLKREMDLLRFALGIDYKDIRLLWAMVDELIDLEGLDFATISERLQMSNFDAYTYVARLSNGKARVLLDTYSGDSDNETALQAILAHPLCAFMTDTILTQRGVHNPASFGTFPRILGHYSRDLKLFSLEEAVRRMTSFSAERIGIKGVGRVEEGMWADLAIFDARTVADNTTPENPEASPTGIKTVIISGQVILQDGKMLSNGRSGRVIRR